MESAWNAQNFNAGFDRVASVDIAKSIVITINRFGREYKVFAVNAAEIVEIVNLKLQEQAAMKNNSPV